MYNYKQFKIAAKNYIYDAKTLHHKYVSNKLALELSFLFYKLNISPNIISLFSTMILLFALLMLNISATKNFIIVFYLLIQISYSFDCSDGTVARLTNKTSTFGGFFDQLLDRFNGFLFFTFLGYFLFNNSNCDYRLLTYITSSLLIVMYQYTVNLQSFYFLNLKGYMRRKPNKSIGAILLRTIYEFIETGSSYFIFSISLYFNVFLYTVYVYGVISFMLIIGIVFLTYKNSCADVEDSSNNVSL